MTKLRRSSILFSILYWTFAGFYLVTIRYVGLDNEMAPSDMMNYASLAAYGGGVGFSIGVFFGLFPFNNVLRFGRRRSFLTVVLTGTACYVIFFAAVILITSSVGNSFSFALQYVVSPDGLIVLFHLSMSSALYHFILQINKRFGPGVLLEYTFGKYFAPKVEARAFMFLDLKSSTTLAEKLEHVAYSSLVQDCYAELTTPLLDYQAQVYQYVGDEVVVSWKIDKTFDASRCHKFFYAFMERLLSRKDYFMVLYGVFPEFKAGVHCGKVTVAEVGELKTEIAYHGDVLNTASRIQSLCNSFQQTLLVSESIIELLPISDKILATFVTETELRGKELTTKVFAIAKQTKIIPTH